MKVVQIIDLLEMIYKQILNWNDVKKYQQFLNTLVKCIKHKSYETYKYNFKLI
jgi:hypothetical protein